MNVCVSLCAFVCVCERAYSSVHVFVSLCACVCFRVSVYACVCLRECVFVCVYPCLSVCP